MDRYLVTVSRPSAAGPEVTENIYVLATDTKLARSIALNIYRQRNNLHSSIQLFAETPVLIPGEPQAAAFVAKAGEHG